MSTRSICYGSKNTLINPAETKVCHFGRGGVIPQKTTKEANEQKTNANAKWKRNSCQKLATYNSFISSNPSTCGCRSFMCSHFKKWNHKIPKIWGGYECVPASLLSFIFHLPKGFVFFVVKAVYMKLSGISLGNKNLESQQCCIQSEIVFPSTLLAY